MYWLPATPSGSGNPLDVDLMSVTPSGSGNTEDAALTSVTPSGSEMLHLQLHPDPEGGTAISLKGQCGIRPRRGRRH